MLKKILGQFISLVFYTFVTAVIFVIAGASIYVYSQKDKQETFPKAIKTYSTPSPLNVSPSSKPTPIPTQKKTKEPNITTKSNKELYKTSDSFENGSFVVGEDIYSGTYYGSYTAGCYLSLNGDDFTNQTKNGSIELRDKDMIVVANCGKWKK